MYVCVYDTLCMYINCMCTLCYVYLCMKYEVCVYAFLCMYFCCPCMLDCTLCMYAWMTGWMDGWIYVGGDDVCMCGEVDVDLSMLAYVCGYYYDDV